MSTFLIRSATSQLDNNNDNNNNNNNNNNNDNNEIQKALAEFFRGQVSKEIIIMSYCISSWVLQKQFP